MKAEIRCKVFPGQFSNEYAVECVDANRKNFSLFAPANQVESDELPTRDKAVDGWLNVTLWETSGDVAVVRLPRESFESCSFVTVNFSQFRSVPEPIQAQP